MVIIITLSIIIVFVILLLCVVTTSKAYDYKHTVDPLTKKTRRKKVGELVSHLLFVLPLQ